MRLQEAEGCNYDVFSAESKIYSQKQYSFNLKANIVVILHSSSEVNIFIDYLEVITVINLHALVKSCGVSANFSKMFCDKRFQIFST